MASDASDFTILIFTDPWLVEGKESWQIPALTAVQPLVHYLPDDYQTEFLCSRPYHSDKLIGFLPLGAAR